MEIRKAKSVEDFQGILALQQQNMLTRGRSYADMPDGFVTLQHTPELLQAMAKECPQNVAVDQGRVVGYALSFLPHMGHLFPVVAPMMSAFEDVVHRGKNLMDVPFVIGGQCCIAESHRGQNLLSRLYGGIQEGMAGTHACCVTEVARLNPRSLRAHLKIGFEVVHTYEAPDHTWDIILWDWRDPATAA